MFGFEGKRWRKYYACFPSPFKKGQIKEGNAEENNNPHYLFLDCFPSLFLGRGKTITSLPFPSFPLLSTNSNHTLSFFRSKLWAKWRHKNDFEWLSIDPLPLVRLLPQWLVALISASWLLPEAQQQSLRQVQSRPCQLLLQFPLLYPLYQVLSREHHLQSPQLILPVNHKRD